jgi:DNA-binding NarL/FixJ family response regulator
MSIRVVLADDHVIVSQGIAALLQSERDIELVGVVRDGRALLEAVEREKPNVAVSDISMPELRGLDAMQQSLANGAQTKFIFLTMHSEHALAAEAFRSGASGYLLKNSAGEELIQAIQTVHKGEMYLTPLLRTTIATLLKQTTDLTLTARQREVLQLIAQGKTAKEVGGILKISTRTVETHKYEVMNVLGAKSTAELVHHAIRMRLLPDC